MELNIYDILLIVALLIVIIAAIITIRRNKGKCAYCSHNNKCPFKKNDVK